MSEPKFKVGDVVLLRSGGPAMTVEVVRKGGDELVCHTKWFDGAEVKRDAFAEYELLNANG